MNDIQMKISIPTDNDGYVLLKCPICGEYFKLTPNDCEDEGVLEIHCPSCGLCSDSYLTEDVVELAMAMVQNKVTDLIHNNLKKLERNKGGIVSFKVNQKPKHKLENPIWAGIQALTVTKFMCCERSAKIKLMLKFTGCYCPFCGVIRI